MDPQRRTLMKGVLASGALTALGGVSGTWADVPPQRSARLALLLPEGATAAPILRGVQAAVSELLQLQVWQLPEVPDSRRLRSSTAALEKLRGQSCLALLSEANAVVLLEWARSAGKSLLWTGAHQLPARSGGSQRHELFTPSAEHSAAPWLAAQLDPLRPDLQVIEHFPQAPRMRAAPRLSVGPHTRPPRSAGALEALGYALGAALLRESGQNAQRLGAAPAWHSGRAGSSAGDLHLASLALQL